MLDAVTSVLEAAGAVAVVLAVAVFAGLLAGMPWGVPLGLMVGGVGAFVASGALQVAAGKASGGDGR